MSDKTFKTETTNGNDRLAIHAVGFTRGAAHGGFVSLRLDGYPAVTTIMQADEARAVADILNRAADFAAPREMSADDLGIAA